VLEKFILSDSRMMIFVRFLANCLMIVSSKIVSAYFLTQTEIKKIN